MSTDNPAEQLAREISSLQSDVTSLQSAARLSDARQSLADFDALVGALPQRVNDLRAHGYLFENDLEATAAALAGRWPALHASVSQQLDQQSAMLAPELTAIEGQLMQLSAASGDPAAAQPLAGRARSLVDALQGKAAASARDAGALYAAFKSEVDSYSGHLSQVEWTLAQVAAAAFRLMPGEGAIQAVGAVWRRQANASKDDPQGVLYLTDARVLFEQKQEIATKKVLFVATEKQMVQKLLFEAPVAAIERAQGTKQGLLGHEDHVEISFGAGAPARAAHFHINGQDSGVWQALLGRARARDFDAGRTVALDPAQADRVRAAPTQCPNCGGAITQAVERGMDSIRCEFCGVVIRL